MKRLLIALSLTVLGAPVYSQDLAQLKAEMEQLSKVVSNAKCTDQEFQRYLEVSKQIEQIYTDRLKSNAVRLERSNEDLAKRLQMLDQQIDGRGAPTTNTQALRATPSLPALTIGLHIEALVNQLVENDPAVKAANDSIAHYSTPFQKFLAFAKDALNNSIPYRGFNYSKEAADLILQEGPERKGLGAAEYKQQRLVDNLHQELMVAVFHLAQVNDDSRLIKLVGEMSANDMKLVLSQYISTEVKGAPLTPGEKQKIKLDVLKLALEKDAVVNGIVEKLHKYNRRSNLSMTISHILPPILSVLSMAPNGAGPAARLALNSYVMATGGNMNDQLTKELFLDRELESRVDLLVAEADLALSSRDLALATRNPVLLKVSEALLLQMTSQEFVRINLTQG